MKIIILCLFVLLLSMGCFSCKILSSGDGMYLKNKPVQLNSSFDLSAEELRVLSLDSDNGNAEASYRLYSYYSFVMNKMSMSEFYLIRAADFGHIQAKIDLSIYLSQSDDLYKRELGMQMLKDAAEKGDETSKRFFEYFTDYYKIHP